MKNTKIQAPSPRIIDVNINRLSEALRMIEDICRFHISDEKQTKKIKFLRSQFDNYRKSYEKYALPFRESEKDLGREQSFDMNKRTSIDDILGSAFGRAQEACRSLEEFSKLEGSKTGNFKEMRYSLYDIERNLFISMKRKRFADKMGLYIIMTNPKVGYEKLSEIAVKNGIRVIQFRDKFMEGRELLKKARAIRSITKNSDTLFIVNDRLDIALLSDADGVHLGQTDIPVFAARRESSGLIIGKSTHNMKQLKCALKEMPDYVGIGPVFPTDSKILKDRVLGLSEAEKMLKESSVPAVCIGGIKEHNLKAVLKIGFMNAAILSYITESGSPEREIKKIQSILRRKNDTER
ncbi:MAG: thiamine phosphate synthase [bacterium]